MNAISKTAIEAKPEPMIAMTLLPQVMRRMFCEMVRKDGADMTQRQLAILLMIYIDGPLGRSVREFAADLRISKPACTRSLDRLVEMGLVTRSRRETGADKRLIEVRTTPKGAAYFRGMTRMMRVAAVSLA